MDVCHPLKMNSGSILWLRIISCQWVSGYLSDDRKRRFKNPPTRVEIRRSLSFWNGLSGLAVAMGLSRESGLCCGKQKTAACCSLEEQAF
jgi:hypothetical protein